MERHAALRLRIFLALVIGLVSGTYAWVSHRILLEADSVPDSVFLWRATRIVLAGGDPYPMGALNHRPVGETDLEGWKSAIEPLYYPMPALLLYLPFATRNFLLGSALFSGVGAALFAFAISRKGLHRLWLCGSMPFVMALHFGQWSTFITVAALLPVLGLLLTAKPNIGLPVVVAKPHRFVIIGCTAIMVVSLLLFPQWPLAWIRNVTGPFQSTAPHPVPLLQAGSLGFLLVLALWRWRRFEARLLFGMACVTQLPFWADQLPLAIVPETKREVIWTVIIGGLGICAYQLFAPKVAYYVPVMQPYALACTYLPALAIVLMRDNVGRMPDLIERVAAHLPAWLRGSAVESTVTV